MTTDAAELARRLAEYLRGENSCGYAALHRYAEFVESMATRLETAERERDHHHATCRFCWDQQEKIAALEAERDEALSKLAEAREAAFQEFEDYHEYQAAMADGMDMGESAKFHGKIAKAIREYPERHVSRTPAQREGE